MLTLAPSLIEERIDYRDLISEQLNHTENNGRYVKIQHRYWTVSVTYCQIQGRLRCVEDPETTVISKWQ